MPSLMEATYYASKTALAFYTRSLREHLRIINSSVKVFELLLPVVDTEVVAARTDKKLSPQKLVEGLIKGLEHVQYTIRVGGTKALYILNRLFPKPAFRLVNPKKRATLLQS